MSRPRTSGEAAGPGPRRGHPSARALALAAAVALAAAGCDDALKHIDTFAFMVDGPAIEAYEQQPRAFPEGAVPVDGQPRYTLQEADTALTNPLAATAANIRRGRQAYGDFCLPCHGEGGAGDGPVVNATGEHPRRLPALPTLDLLSDRARAYSDGYIYGMITNGRGFMPSYRRIPPRERWQLVLYVRHLQRNAAGSGSAGSSPATRGAATGGDRE